MMRLRVLHETHYVYSVPIHALAMEARLQPCNDEYQSCQRYRLSVLPKTTIETYTTFSEVPVHYWTLLKASEVRIISECVVDIRERPLSPVEAPPIALDPVSFYPYLNPTPLTGISPEVAAFADQFSGLAAEDWYQAVAAVQRAIHDTVGFNVGCTSTETTATDVLQMACGVCQDFSHLMLAVLRCLGIPARYVSGYLNQDLTHDPIYAGGITYHSMSQEQSNHHEESDHPLLHGENSVRGSGASHAWVEVYLGPEIGWRGFDPTNNLFVDQNFVRIGAGRDFNDITPVKGVHKGPAEENLQVTVNVTQQR